MATVYLAETEKDDMESVCIGCFGAANGDCENCNRRGDTRRKENANA